MFNSELRSYIYEQQETDTYKRTMKYAPEYNVIFSFLLEDPSKQNAHWDINTALECLIFNEEI